MSRSLTVAVLLRCANVCSILKNHARKQVAGVAEFFTAPQVSGLYTLRPNNYSTVTLFARFRG
jgi:hypothetical protein